MAENPVQRIIPYLYYESAAAALEFLQRAYGFEERMRLPGPGGAVMHAEAALGEQIVMLSDASADFGQSSPRAFASRASSVMVYVDDVDAHFARAKAAGAAIQSEPEDMFWGDRMYTCADLEGHLWFFATHVRDVPPEEMKVTQP